jgi:hypothetical protein
VPGVRREGRARGGMRGVPFVRIQRVYLAQMPDVDDCE